VPSDRSQIVYPRPDGRLQVAATLPIWAHVGS
jgi:hypothetical protein